MIAFPAFNPKNALQNGSPRPIYGVWGDAYLQDSVLAQLLEWTLADGERDFNFDQLDGESAKIADVLGACANLPFLSDRRAVIVKRAEKLEGLAREEAGKKPKKEKSGLSPAQKLTEGFKTLPPTTVLILLRTPETPEPGDKPGERCLNAALDAEIEGKGKAGLLINCSVSAKNSGLAVAVMEKEARTRGISLPHSAATHLVKRCGANIAFLCGELEKCALRAGIGNPITPQIIDEMTQRALQDTVFDLTDAIGERRGQVALSIVHDLVERGVPPEKVLANVVTHLRKLMQARAFLDANLAINSSVSSRIPPRLAAQLPQGRDNLALALETQNWIAPRFNSQARNFSSPQLARALELAFQTDLAFKGIEGDGGFDSKHHSAAALEIFVAKLCAGG